MLIAPMGVRGNAKAVRTLRRQGRDSMFRIWLQMKHHGRFGENQLHQ
jgi:hypothetical protein